MKGAEGEAEAREELPRQGEGLPDEAERPNDAIVIAATSKHELVAYALVTAALLLVFFRHLVSAVCVGMVFYMLLDAMKRMFTGRISHRAVRPLSIVSAALIALASVSGVVAILFAVVRVQIRNIPALMQRMAEIIGSTRLIIVKLAGMEMLTVTAIEDAEDVKLLITTWLKEHGASLSLAGQFISVAAVHLLLAVLLATMVFLRRVRKPDEPPHGPLAGHLAAKVRSFYASFAQVVGAQARISAINTLLTSIYILIVIPLAVGERLNFSYTMIFITFVAGLLPVLGNLISNTVIVVVSLGFSNGLAVASLAFLVGIHKLEYVINSKIVGIQTNSQVWEILLSLIVGQALFGFPGLVMGPIVYTFIKGELRAKALV